MTSHIVVDSHSHIFNAEDLPIDGFIKKLSPAPRLITSVISIPLDRLAAWVAPGSSEADYLLEMLAGAAGRESPASDPERGTQLVSDAEVDRLLLDAFRGAADPLRLEAAATFEDALALELESVPLHEVYELEAWLREWGDPDLEAELVDGSAEEGLFDAVTWAYTRGKSLRRAVGRYVSALRLITRHRHLVAADLAQTYPEVTLFVPALVDFTYTARDRPATPVPEQIAIHSLVSKLSVVGGIPGAEHVRIHPFVGFCPYREVEASELKHWDADRGHPNRYVPFADPTHASSADLYDPRQRFDPARAKPLDEVGPDWYSHRLRIDHVERSLDLVRYAIEQGGFAGVKIYPPAGFMPLGNVVRFGERRGQRLDAALRSLYAYCVAMDVPILTHAAHSNGFDDDYEELASPVGWELALAEFNELRVCFGHFGHMHGINEQHSEAGPFSWPSQFVSLIDRYPNVFADVGNSKVAISPKYRNRFLPMLHGLLGGSGTTDRVHAKRRKRVMFGTDYWMNTLAPAHAGFFSAFDDLVRDEFDDDLRTWFMGENALRFLGLRDDEGERTQTRAWSRLDEFYAGHNQPGKHDRPAWLTLSDPE